MVNGELTSVHGIKAYVTVHKIIVKKHVPKY